MRVSVWPSPAREGAELVAEARLAESLGYDGVWLADHFMPNAPDPRGPVHEAWTTLAALAVQVPRVRLGTLVTGNTYRHPAVLANMAAGVDRLSGGRLVLGVGAGWQENEHRAYGIPLPPIGERLARLDEACAVLRGLLHGERASFAGRFYRLEDAPCEPKPLQARVPLLVGGGGERVTLRIAARHADEWNVWGTPETLRHKGAILDRHAEDLGRDPAAIERCAVALWRLVDDPDARAGAGAGGGSGPPVLVGTAEQLRETVAAYRDAGVAELVVPDFNLGPSERRDAVLERLAREVFADFRAA